MGGLPFWSAIESDSILRMLSQSIELMVIGRQNRPFQPFGQLNCETVGQRHPPESRFQGAGVLPNCNGKAAVLDHPKQSQVCDRLQCFFPA
jgi:hypothetical protein